MLFLVVFSIYADKFSVVILYSQVWLIFDLMLLDYLRIHIIHLNTFAKYPYRLIIHLFSRLFYIHRLIFYMTHAIAAKDGRAKHVVFLYRANLDGTDIRLLVTSYDYPPTPLTIDYNNTVCWANSGK